MIKGRYKIRELIGIGGNGEVWQAYDNNLSKDVAMKIVALTYYIYFFRL
jgi:serine/threonine protein kinase